MAVTALLTLTTVARAADVPYISGGVGSDEREELRANERDYNLKVITARSSGDYLSGVVIVIQSAAGERMLETTMAGHILLAKLAPGSYTITATADGQTVSQTVTIETPGSKQVHFRWADRR